jgi:hypothetical protein
MRYQNHIRGQEIPDGKLEGNVAVITGANSSSIRSVTAPQFLSEAKLEKEGR